MTTENRIKEMLTGKDTDLQEIALYTLMQQSDCIEYVDLIIKCAVSKSSKVRLAAFFALDKINKKSLMPIYEVGLNDKIWKIRAISAISMAKFKNAKAVPMLMDIIKADIPDQSIHKKSIEALGKYKKKEYIDIFTQLLSHRRVVTRIKAVEAMAKINSEDVDQILIKAQEVEKDARVASKIKAILYQRIEKRKNDS